MEVLRLTFLSCAIATTFGAAVNVILGDPVEFPATGNCKTAGATLEQRLTGDSARQVAYFDGVWRPGAGYEDRMSPNDSVILNSTNMNDDGLFELTCGGDTRRHQLNVVEASEVSAMEEGAVRFPFHCVTAGKHGVYKVDRNGQLALELDVSSGEIRNGTGLQRRLSVSPEWRSHGDLTLTLRGVDPEDEGDYYLSYSEDGRVKKRSAVRLKVRNPDQVPSTPQPVTCPTERPTERPTEDGMGTWSIVSLTAAVVSLIVGPLAFCCGWKMRSCTSNKTFQHPRDVLMGLLPKRGPAGTAES